MRNTVIAIAIISVWSCTAFADNFYLGANLGSATYDGTAAGQLFDVSDFDNLPASAPINARIFDSSDFSWSAYAGWAVTEWLSVEAGYADLGEGTSTMIFVPVSSTGGTLLVGGGSSSPTTTTVNLRVREWYLGPKVAWALSDRIKINAFAGVSNVNFDAGGEWVVARDGTMPFEFSNVPVRSPGDQTGTILGLGLQWKFSDRFSLDLAYRQHDTKVLDVDTLTIGVLFSL